MPIRRTLDLPAELLEEFRRSGEVSAYLVEQIDARVWRAAPPRPKARTIADIVAHMYGLRRTFARMGGARTGLPALNRRTFTQAKAARGLRASTERLARQFETAIAAGRTRVPGMPRRLVDMLLYLVQHDAHHRGQITLLAHDLGAPVGGAHTTRLWGWSKLPVPPSKA
jgi:uncharacterized damage-inducible protein DinB